jgi:hypothetical protein
MRSAAEGVCGDGLRRTVLPASRAGKMLLAWMRSAARQHTRRRPSTQRTRELCEAEHRESS